MKTTESPNRRLREMATLGVIIFAVSGALASPGRAAAANPSRGKPPAGPHDIHPSGVEVAAAYTPVVGIAEESLLPIPEQPVSTIDPEVYQALQDEAAVSPFGETPNEIVPLLLPTAFGEVTAASGEDAGDGLRSVTSASFAVRTFAGLDYGASLPSSSVYRPPDTHVARSSLRVLEGTNSALRLFDTTGAQRDTKSLNTFFGVGGTTVFDPRVVHDRLGPNQRFFVVALQRTDGNNETDRTSTMFVAVSRQPDPTSLAPGNWCTYQIDAKRDVPTGLPTWADFPMIGVGEDAFLISNDQFTFNPPDPLQKQNYKYGILRVIRKLPLANNALGCPTYSASVFLLPQILQGTAGTEQYLGHVQPAVHVTAPSSFPGTLKPVYMVSTVAPDTSTYRVWRVRNADSGSPTVQVVNLSGTQIYRTPTRPAQPKTGCPAVSGAGILLDAKDNRILQVAAVGDTLWATHTTRCTVGGVNKACVRVLRFFVADSGGTPLVSLLHDVTFASPDTETDLSYFFPSIAANSANQTAVVFLYSSKSLCRFQSAAWTVKYSIDQVYAPATRFSEGNCMRTYDRLGDYVGAHTSTDLATFWLAAESAAPAPPPPYRQECVWKTHIVEVVP